MPNEQNTLENISTASNKYFVPLIWATSVVARARKEGKIKSDLAVQRLVAVGASACFEAVYSPIVYWLIEPLVNLLMNWSKSKLYLRH